MSGSVILTADVAGAGPPLSQTFDVLSIDREPSQIVPRHPVDVGVDVTDHLQREPDAYLLQVRVTNTPFRNTAPSVGSDSFVRQADVFLNRVSTSFLTMTLEGEPPIYPVVLEGWGSRQGAEEARTYRLRLTQVRIAQALSVLIPVVRTSSTGASSAQDLGAQSPTDKGESAFVRGLRFLGLVGGES